MTLPKRILSIYIAERKVLGVTLHDLAIAQAALIESCRRLSAAGEPIEYVRSTFIPSQSRCICAFIAASPEIVRKANDLAQFPWIRIEAAFDLPASNGPRRRK